MEGPPERLVAAVTRSVPPGAVPAQVTLKSVLSVTPAVAMTDTVFGPVTVQFAGTSSFTRWGPLASAIDTAPLAGISVENR